jgi:spermidine synthase
MPHFFEELDYRVTPIGPISLRRRQELRLDKDVLEILLGDEHLMSDLFTTSEIALAKYALQVILGNKPLSVLVGGLGLGYTAVAALEDKRVNSMLIVEKLLPVIRWHKTGLIPLGKVLSDNPKVRFIEGDFFEMASSKTGFDVQSTGRQFDVIILDIDHTPNFHLSSSHAGFYQSDGLAELKEHLLPKGVFGLWSNEPPDKQFISRLRSVFSSAKAMEVAFYNPLQDNECVQCIYLAHN